MDLEMKDRTEERVIRLRVGEDVLKKTTFQMGLREVKFQQKCEGRVNVSRAGNRMNKGEGGREAKCSLYSRNRQ